MLERPWYVSYNYALAAAALALSAFGLVVIKSATLHSGQARSDLHHQAAYLVIGVAGMIVLSFTDYHVWQRLARPIYVIDIVILAAVALAGHSALGAQRWIGFGPFVFQPSEPAKLLTTLSVAAIIASPKRSYLRMRELIAPIVAMIVPTALVIKQPDLGTALVLVAILTTMLFFGLPRMTHFVAYLGALGAAGGFTLASPFVLKSYQRQRLLVFLNPRHDPQGAGWSLMQSMIAVGSGRLAGKGLYRGTQTQLGFVPEHSTDFIFTVIGEELGFLGAVSAVALYAVLLASALACVSAARDRYGLLVTVGIIAMIVFHIVVNIGMTVGIMPITGIPLPFVSYGGSSLITFLMSVGILLNVYLQRDKVSFREI
ncbi:MAG: rod shape-determining protein RodA [Candidatus Eremiobacteraeota bacterium]|nr:rod shape-determining protein RodA [Candidatus Eremiobacteraeota bacterium]MBC5827915.1 rod shape-determining protein RodA [Candidatus Eremiobacteraeota bacterium]